jgi:hypothetical protein
MAGTSGGSSAVLGGVLRSVALGRANRITHVEHVPARIYLSPTKALAAGQLIVVHVAQVRQRERAARQGRCHPAAERSH